MKGGTSTGSDITASTGVEPRSGTGTATACLTWTMPRMSSTLSPITGNRE